MNTRAILLALLVVGCGNKKSEPAPDTKPAGSASSTVTAVAIPATPVAGKIHNEAFTVKKVTLLTGKGFNEWRMSITGATTSAENAAVRLPVRGALGVGKSVESGAVPLSAGGARVPSINITNGPKNSSTTEASYRIEITKWDVKPCPEDGESNHEGGLASGKILVKVPTENVEVVGTFTDATVSYAATPDWAYR